METFEVAARIVGLTAATRLRQTYRFPLVVAPRYCPGAPLDGQPVGDGIAPDTDCVPDASRIKPPVLLPGMKSPVRLAITACDDVTALVALLEALADFSTAAGGCERWWERPAVQRP